MKKVAHIHSSKRPFSYPHTHLAVIRVQAVLVFLVFLLLPSAGSGTVVTSDTTWSGEIPVEEDVYVPEGVTLTISSGAVLRISPSESTKTEPEFLSPQTEIIVRGTLRAEGEKESPVTFLSPDSAPSSWAGIIIDGGTVHLRSCAVRDAETGVEVIGGSFSMTGCMLENNRYGLTVHGGDAAVRVEDSRAENNDYGIVLLNGARINGRDFVAGKNRKRDRYSGETKTYQVSTREFAAQKQEQSRVYEDEVILGTAVWQGKIQVNGIIRVPENARLVIVPGTVVEFRKRDTNNDGIGENGLFIQGGFVAKGTEDNPILFRSAEEQKGMSDWDSINILNSDRAQNLIEHCQIENAYRGLHFHFANVAVRASVIRNNYRAMQFQESLVHISGTHFYGNKSVLWARDSEIMFADNVVFRNTSGINLFRNIVTLKDNFIINNRREGLRVREGVPLVEENHIDGNRYGLMVVDAVYGSFGRNIISHNLEFGLALRGTDNLDVRGNVIQANGLTGVMIQKSSARISHNLISDNGERGIGILSFFGTITGNNIAGNGLYNLGIDGDSDVDAPSNWWGAGDVRSSIYDREDDPVKGAAHLEPVLHRPVMVSWPLKTVQADSRWRGDLVVEGTVTVMPGVHLAVLPDTRVLFSEGAGLTVHGTIRAEGEEDGPVIFTAYQGEAAGTWNEIRLDHAAGSLFSHCLIEKATWALHVHFTDFTVEDCSFINNYGGLRFTSGPLSVRHSLFRGNEIGIRSFRGMALITDNVITGNRNGIFVREKGGGLVIRKNNIFDNSSYNIRIGDFNDEDVDARENWWGSVTPSDTIFDARNEPGIGMVHYDPYARQPFPRAVSAGAGGEKGQEIKDQGQGAEKK